MSQSPAILFAALRTKSQRMLLLIIIETGSHFRPFYGTAKRDGHLYGLSQSFIYLSIVSKSNPVLTVIVTS